MKNCEILLHDSWRMRMADGEWMDATVPGSMYSNLMANGKMSDPFFGENQYDACKLSENDSDFESEFSVDESLLKSEKLILRFEGLDTLASVTLNGKHLGDAINMHRVWEYDVTDVVKGSGNKLQLHFSSPTKYITKKYEERVLWGVATTINGFGYLRKAHYMFGWDWGPQLPDMGIWRPVKLLGISKARIDSVFARQNHEGGAVKLLINVETQRFDADATLTAKLKLTAPDGQVRETTVQIDDSLGKASIDIENPKLWWPNGYGEQPLYTLETTLFADGEELESKTQRIGLRTVTISQDKDEWGSEFCFLVNGIKIFGMGADYIPEDQILSRCTPEKTRNLLEKCAYANFNHIRVWGGGYYPDDWFFDICDELGLLVWHDFMFACSVYKLSDDFKENITIEAIENIKRLRHHACMALWCGNNEMETAWDCWNIIRADDLREDYLYQNEVLFPSLCKEYCPDTFYWPSSPSSGGNFDKPNDYNRGDVHYWDVWHGYKTRAEFRKYYFRFCSEYGFMAIPNIKTIRTFANEEDINLFSPVMEAHEKCSEGMRKLVYYIWQEMRYPSGFENLIYATQLIQADAIRANVEHMRRNRGRCMGSTYWQVNDTNPVISWSSIDYEGRLKALHYYARKFYSPILLSADETNPAAIVLNISSELMDKFEGKVTWALRDNSATVLESGSCDVSVDALSSVSFLTLDLSDKLADTASKRSRYIEYTLFDKDNNAVSSGTSIFVKAKQFKFVDPCLAVKVTETANTFEITVSAEAYAKSVCLDLADADCTFSDNWFDIHAGNVTVSVQKDKITKPLTLAEFEKQLQIKSIYDIK